MAYQAANNLLTAKLKPQESPSRPLPELLRFLQVSTAFGVAVGRSPAVGRSATLAVAEAQARALSERPHSYAESGPVTTVSTRQGMDALVGAGAADESIQVIRSFEYGQVTFSDHCSACDRWTWCGNEQRAAACFGGQPYRVVFDRTPAWDLKQDMRCMDCGATFRMAETSEGRSPWSVMNQWQMRCKWCSSLCERIGDLSIAEESGTRFVRYTSVTPRRT